jgi:histidyl-tRNA synthetase
MSGGNFGLDRIYLVVELNLFPVTATSKALFINGDTEAFYAMKAIKELRNAGVKSNCIPMLQKWQNNSSMQIKEVFRLR